VKIKSLILFFVVLFSVSGSVWACDDSGWAEPGPKDPFIQSLSYSITLLKNEFPKIVIESSPFPSACDKYDYYFIRTADGKLLDVSIPIPSGVKNQGTYLKIRVEQLLKTPMDTLLKIMTANKLFHDEAKQMEDNYGVYFNIPQTISLSKKINEGKELVVAVTGNNTEINSKIYVGLVEYIPGKETYSDQELYQKGELLQIVKTTLLPELKKRASRNIKSNPESSSKDWKVILDNLNKL